MNLEGARVKMRSWIESDIGPFAAMNADGEVMEFFPEPLTAEQSLAAFERLRNGLAERGWGFWAVEIGDEFAGFAGLGQPSFQAYFTPCLEIGWRFRRQFWGRGYALEAARLALGFAFEILGRDQVVSFTSPLNHRSLRLMERLGMTNSEADRFEHPMLPHGHVLRPHVLYRISNPRLAPP
jgi:RimJ/RimL family protein N-acetyltransferase